MSKVSRLMTLYVLKAILPYLLFSWLLLTVILFVQQAGRHAEIFFGNRIPPNLLWQLTWALLPNVIAFTAPMAVLVGVIIGVSRLRSDSELVSMRAAGVGSWQILVPILIVGILICAFSFAINLKGIPLAAQIVRRVGIQAALAKLESPIEPGQFNTDITDYVIYVRAGDMENGQWRNVFVFNENKDKTQARIVTAEVGRLDTSEENSELVLENAQVTTIPAANTQTGFAHEEVKNVRFAIPTKRKELIERLAKVQEFPEEMGLNELAAYAKTKTGREKVEADLLWQRRLTLSLTPLLFAFLGASLSLRFNRGGRGWGAAFALLVLLGYYLIALFGEQLSRTGFIPAAIGGAIPMFCALAIGVWAIKAKQRASFLSRIDLSALKFWSNEENGENGGRAKKHSRLFTSWRSGIMDFDIFSNLVKYFALTLGFLIIIYLIFTVFELWKFVIGLNNGMSLLGQYLVYLFPYVLLQIIPSTLMIAILATYVIKSRNSEVVSWIAAGQSVFRLLVPCLLLMLVVGWLTWEIQERIVPFTNRQQDSLRSQIRGGLAAMNKEGRYWVAGRNRLYSFTSTSDASTERAKDLTVYEFGDSSQANISRILKAPEASRKGQEILLEGQVQSLTWAGDKVNVETFTMAESSGLAEVENPFEQIYFKPTHLSAAETLERIRQSDSQAERRNLEVNLQRKYSTPFLPLVIMLFTAPFALSLGRKGRVITVGLAIGVWLVFMGLSNTFEQLGISGQLSAKLAVWNPLILFSILGAYLLSRVRT
jgi:LPS export ABC transporter permease LptF/LPS export ABC transporter permease LptG